MSHFTEKEWKGYTEGTLDKGQQTVMEDHLYECDACLADYLQFTQQLDHYEVPETPKGQMEELLKEMKVTKIEKKQTKRKQNQIWHYVIAASLTLTLMSTGLFHQVTGAWTEAESSLTKKAPESMTENLMKKTLSVIDSLQSTK
jgi:predicted anti-sigma-YlaC factor YlaD